MRKNEKSAIIQVKLFFSFFLKKNEKKDFTYNTIVLKYINN